MKYQLFVEVKCYQTPNPRPIRVQHLPEKVQKYSVFQRAYADNTSYQILLLQHGIKVIKLTFLKSDNPNCIIKINLQTFLYYLKTK